MKSYNIVYDPLDPIVGATNPELRDHVLLTESKSLIGSKSRFHTLECGCAWFVRVDSICDEIYLVLVTDTALGNRIGASFGTRKDMLETAESILWGPRERAVVMTVKPSNEDIFASAS